jgi:hypothetical protein
MSTPVFTAAQLTLITKRIYFCTAAIEAVQRKRSWRPSARAMAAADYTLEREEWKRIQDTMLRLNSEVKV